MTACFPFALFPTAFSPGSTSPLADPCKRQHPPGEKVVLCHCSNQWAFCSKMAGLNGLFCQWRRSGVCRHYQGAILGQARDPAGQHQNSQLLHSPLKSEWPRSYQTLTGISPPWLLSKRLRWTIHSQELKCPQMQMQNLKKVHKIHHSN